MTRVVGLIKELIVIQGRGGLRAETVAEICRAGYKWCPQEGSEYGV